jgi:hypothetical protein
LSNSKRAFATVSLSMVCIFKTTTKYKRKCLHEKKRLFSPNLNSFRSPRSSEGLTIETLVKLDCLDSLYFSFSLQVEISSSFISTEG